MSAKTKSPRRSEGAESGIEQVCRWVETEIVAGMILNPLTDADRSSNNANQRAVSILRKYAKGEGLFQPQKATDLRASASPRLKPSRKKS